MQRPEAWQHTQVDASGNQGTDGIVDDSIATTAACGARNVAMSFALVSGPA